MRQFVFDSSAIVSYFENRPAKSKAFQYIEQVQLKHAEARMSVINYGEVVYLFWRKGGDTNVAKLDDLVLRLPIILEPVDISASRHAAMLKARHQLPYADSFAASLAMRLNGTLVTADPDFKKLGQQLKILWIK